MTRARISPMNRGPRVSFPVFRFIRVVWEGFGGHFEGEVLDALLTVVLVRAGNGVMAVDAVEGGGVCQHRGTFVGARGSRVSGGAFADRFGQVAGVGGYGRDCTSDGA